MSASNSSRSSSAVSSKAVSEGRSSDSGMSLDDTPPKKGSERITAALDAATALCSMCDEAASSLLCSQCGRLSFCMQCCISLHDNKFLASHVLVSIDPLEEGLQVTVAQLKDRQAKRSNDKKASLASVELPAQQQQQQQQQEMTSKGGEEISKQLAPNDSAIKQQPQQGADIDVAQLAADKSIITARLNELTSCRGLLNTVCEGLQKERFQCKDVTITATEAVRKKFDVLRQGIAQKEAEYIEYVERAARTRLEDATKYAFEASASLTECDAFIDQMRLQIDRLGSSKKLFAEARLSMMSATETRLRSVDDMIQRLQHELDRISTISLGVHVPIEKVIAAIEGLSSPASTQNALISVAEVHVKAIPSEKFLNSPGVKVVKQSEAEVGGTQRQSFLQELEKLRATSLKEVKGLQPSPATVSQSVIAKIAQKYQTNSNATAPSIGAPRAANSPMRVGQCVPRELEKLRQQVSVEVAAAGVRRGPTLARASSPAPRADSPSAQARRSPMRQTQLNSSIRNSSPIRSSASNPDATPGPGAYYRNHDFTTKSILSTPPRRR